MVCLNSKDATRVPLTVAEKELLVEAGLGEKKVTIDDMSCSPQDFKAAIVSTFPKLEDCGGFELLRCLPHGLKKLEPISAAVAQYPKLLKSVVGNGRVFIRPIQKDLSLRQDENLTNAIQVFTIILTYF
ncbi:MAG: hypothetical protein MPL62_15790 [Alphaproteobacteria bacterium]|nr:hypothetical protein [Alphaproteobacteria bacterium]